MSRMAIEKEKNTVSFNGNVPGETDKPLTKLPPIFTRRMSRAPPSRREMLGLGKETPEQEEILDDDVLFSRLQKIFDKKEEEEESGLTISEFKDAMRKTVGRNSTEDEIELLFMKVDANCDQTVDWEEYVTYNLLEYKEKTLMLEMLREKPFPMEIREIDSRHRDVIIKILFYPNVRKTGAKSCRIDSKNGKYVTLSKEGVLGIWSLSMRNIKYYNANHYQNRHTQPWFVDMVAMYNVNMVAITSTDRDITIFDLSGKKFTMRYYVTGFESCLTAMDYWVDPTDLNKALLLLGDTAGSVFAMRFETCLRGGPFGNVSGKNKCKRVSFPEVSRGFLLGVKAHKLSNVHADWVNQVKYLPDIDCFLSSCQNQQTGLFFGDFTGKKSHVYFKVNKGVLCFDYSHMLNIIVTGGMDYLLRVWNPYVNNKAIVLLKGHTKPVNHVIINATKNQVISIDKGRSLRVYDLRDQSCLQQISGRIIKFDNFAISAVNFHPGKRTMLLAATQIVMLEKREEEERNAEVVTHNRPVVGALYSRVFNSVVSACQESVVSVWDSNTGDKLMQFVNAHCRVERGVVIPVEITTLCFDHNGRRLLTGARNGTVHVWNFNNGSLMQNFELPDNSDVTGIVTTRHSFYVSGWGKTVYIYIDGGGEEHRKSWKVQHKEDVLCIAYLEPNIIATGAYDGDVVIWSRDTGQVFSRLNAYESVKAVGEYTKRRNKLMSKLESERSTPQTSSTPSDIEEGSTTPSQWSKRKTKMAGTLGFLGTKPRPKPTEEVKEPEICEHPLLDALDSNGAFSGDNTNYSRDDYDNLCKKYESAVEKIVFLESRELNHKDTATLVTSGAEGWIRFWSMHHEGGLLGQFNAAHRLGESILAIKCGTNEHFFVTGDTQGYVKIWDIRDYCISKKMNLIDRKKHFESLKKTFTFFRVENYNASTMKYTIPDYLRNMFSRRPPPSSSNPNKTLRYPPLVNSFRAHTRSIHSVDYVTERDILITASADCSVRIWTINGQFIGTFGGESWKPLPKVVTNDYFLSQIPTDIRRAGSARTLKVMHGGKTPMWQSAFSILRHRGVERLKKQFSHLQLPEEEEEEVAPTENLETSNILGKSYKRTMRHRMTPKLPKFIETPGSVAVYHALPFVDLTPLDSINEAMKELQDRRACNLALNRLRGVHKKQQEVPAIVSLFNKVVNKRGPVVKKVQANRIKKVAERYQGPSNQTHSAPPSRRGKNVNNDEGSQKVTAPPPTIKAPTASHDEVRSEASDTDTEADSETALDQQLSSNMSTESRMNVSHIEVKLASITE